MKIILASTSPRRKEILSMTNLNFEVEPSAFEEDMTLQMDPYSLAKYLSHGKASAVAQKYNNALVIGSDTFIVYKNQLLGKPHTPDRAYEMLKMLSGDTHSVLTGVAIIDTSKNKTHSHVEETKVYFRDLSDQEINDYIATGEPLDRAGSYAIQGGAKHFIDRIEGDILSVVGLPLDALINILNKEFNLFVKKKV